MPNGLLPPFITKFNKDLYEFLQRRPGVALESLEHATAEKDYPLDKERDNHLIHDRSGDRIFITSATGIAYFRANKITGPKYKLRVGAISLPFEKLFLSNAAQPGKKVSIIIGYEAFIDFTSAHYVMKMLNVADSEINPATEEKQDSVLSQLDMKLSALRDALTDATTPKDLKDLYDQLYSMRGAATPKSLKEIWDVLTTISGLDFATDAGLGVIAGLDFATQTTLALIKAKTDNLVPQATETPTTYNLEMAEADTEYTQVLPDNLKQLTFFVRDLTNFRYAWVTGKVEGPSAPYTEVPANGVVFLDKLKWPSKTLYFACGSVGKVMQIEVLT